MPSVLTMQARILTLPFFPAPGQKLLGKFS
jgi:hypothetical protein